MASGYIYVLVNSSMPELVKVGKTTREPAQRAAELSGVTGVATPFIIAFEQFFYDCDSAEEFIHASLERHGLRQTNNREFFRAQPNDVIRVVLQTPGIADKPQDGLEREDEVDDDLLSKDDPLPDFKLEGWQQPKPWDEILEEADRHYYGEGDYIQDNVEALKLYKYAARLGSLDAYEKIGNIYDGEEGVKQNLNKAVQYWKEGAKRGNYYCYASMSSLFLRNGQVENFYKAFKQFLNHRSLSQAPEVETFDTKHFYAVSLYIRLCLIKKIEVRFIDDLRLFGDELKQNINSQISRGQEETSLGSDPASGSDKELLKWVQNNLCTQNTLRQETLLTVVDPAPSPADNVKVSPRKSSVFAKLFSRS